MRTPYALPQELLGTRIRLRPLLETDASFIFTLVNDPAWLEFIGDRGVHNQADAQAFITQGPQAMYAKCGLGLLLVEQRVDGQPIGLCGLLQRDNLSIPDLGFAFLSEKRGQGFALEAAQIVLHYAFDELNLASVAAITAVYNPASQGLLKRLGFVFVSMHHMNEQDPGSHLYQLNKPS
jgi:[ribosomal protein S5]-alanine N-acetyltransferase